MSSGPVGAPSGEQQLINKESEIGRELGCVHLVGFNVIEVREEIFGETEMVSGPRDGPTTKISGIDTGNGVSLSCNGTGGSILEKINFRDEVARPSLTPW